MELYDQNEVSCFIQCSVCNYVKPFQTHHCSSCNCCVMNMDHHCPWINNCNGLKTQKKFMLFLLYLQLYLLTTLGVVIWQQFFEKQTESVLNIFIVLILILALFFQIFAFVMLKDQVVNMMYNTTEIDELQYINFQKRNLWVNIAQIFGKNPLLWMIPVGGGYQTIKYELKQGY